ncbi:MAG: RDD family protein [Aeromicrobium sp.]|uniref:RDD family protein n=1 Tax=Aeromicrobium sp. TaxID=1871063 RepID=UPI002602D726|nr:RDD family protein [Aeromicrobium sp.]MDF1705752.1 RDD family protein [Aeromicrobium sp.]
MTPVAGSGEADRPRRCASGAVVLLCRGAQTGRPLGFGLSFARQIVHVVDAIPCYLGFLWPLWDRENRTFADMMLSTRVVKR